MKREFDIVVWGATSFVGQIVARYLLRRLGTDGEIRWALAARDKGKLESLCAELKADLPMLIGDSFDSEFLHQMASRTKVVLTTVGPYQKYGEALVAACATEGTDYCDLTGEIPFIRKMMDTHSETAVESGARLVNCAGFDSLPSDLGVLFLNDFCLKEFGAPVTRVEMHVEKVRGGVSGGTIASAIETIEQLQAEPKLAKLLQNPYAACPEGRREGIRQPDLMRAKRSEFNNRWLSHFVMAPVNTKVVHASNARLDYPYGRDFEYSEWQPAPNAPLAYLTNFGLLFAMTALYFKWSRALLNRFVLPQPGQGPTPEQQQRGFFELHFHGRTRDGRTALCRVTGDADPGYGSTAKQIAEVAISLAKTFGEGSGGFHTTASSLGLSLIEPLTESAGLTFEAWVK